ncbi:hypothetical protein [Ectobacillus panaciterrae]|uniref:hypothetical protein n=1 Tax=Ectobacillus panaciterrae TaxID=363872 RepID=UPI000411D4E4|nr:hypothetical protein [Ectobacillus panaciterrae]
MSIREEQLWVNDYLDLYLYAGSIGDISWQQEIIEKLQNFHNEIRKELQSFTLNNVLKEYKRINEEILTIYHQLREQSSNGYLQEKIWELKQQRISLGHQICLAKNQSL